MNKRASLNHFYRLVWNHVSQAWAAVAENTTRQSKTAGAAKPSKNRLVRAISITLSAIMATQPVMALDTNALPTQGSVVAGQANISTQGNHMIVNQSTHKAAINWQTFDVGSQAHLQFVQPSSSSVTLNRVMGNNGSQIMGRISANGQVFLVNQNGILFGQNTQVNTGGLVASTLDITNQDFLDGNHQFKGGDTGNITNQGTLLGKYVALLAPEVINEGVVTAQTGGTVALAAGKDIELSFDEGLSHVVVHESVVNALIDSKHLIHAEGGTIIMSASARDEILSGTINHSGTAEAAGAVTTGGNVHLLAADVHVSGTLDASGTSYGGIVTLEGDRLALVNAKIKANGALKGGKINIGGDFQGKGNLHRAQLTTVDANTKLEAKADTGGQGGDIILWSDGTTVHAGGIDTRAGENSSGFAEVSGKKALQFLSSAVEQTHTAKLLLDPDNITITSFGSDSASNINGSTQTGVNSFIKGEDLANLLDTTSVSLHASENITFDDVVAVSSTNTHNLTLEADMDDSGTGNIVFYKKLKLAGDLTITKAANITVNEGADITADGKISFNTQGNITINNTNVTANNGLDLKANTNVTVDNSIITYNGDANSNLAETFIQAGNDVTLSNSTLDANIANPLKATNNAQLQITAGRSIALVDTKITDFNMASIIANTDKIDNPNRSAGAGSLTMDSNSSIVLADLGSLNGAISTLVVDASGGAVGNLELNTVTAPIVALGLGFDSKTLSISPTADFSHNPTIKINGKITSLGMRDASGNRKDMALNQQGATMPSILIFSTQAVEMATEAELNAQEATTWGAFVTQDAALPYTPPAGYQNIFDYALAQPEGTVESFGTTSLRLHDNLSSIEARDTNKNFLTSPLLGDSGAQPLTNLPTTVTNGATLSEPPSDPVKSTPEPISESLSKSFSETNAVLASVLGGQHSDLNIPPQEDKEENIAQSIAEQQNNDPKKQASTDKNPSRFSTTIHGPGNYHKVLNGTVAGIGGSL